jgi:hypothetical protein
MQQCNSPSMHRAFTISVRENDLQNLKEEPKVFEIVLEKSGADGQWSIQPIRVLQEEQTIDFLALIAGSHEADCAAKRKVIGVTGLMVDRWSVSDVTAKFMRPQRHTRRQPNDSP